MTGPPGHSGTRSVRWMRERLVTSGLADEQIILCDLRPESRLGPADLEPASFSPEFAPLLQRLQRLLRDGRGLSVYVTGRRSDAWARQHAALQIGIGLTQLGRRVVVVDADFLRPGFGGLIDDPHAEGLVDMVRFGRSCGSLLLRPAAAGPCLLAAGSFPADEPMPFGPEALRSVVYRVSQVCEVALYVGPLPMRNEMNPLARVCDHVIYGTSDDDPEAEREVLEHVGELQRLSVSLVGVAVYGPVAEAEAAELQAGATAAPPPAFEEGFLYAPPVRAPGPGMRDSLALPPGKAAVGPAVPEPLLDLPRVEPTWRETVAAETSEEGAPIGAPLPPFEPAPFPDLAAWEPPKEAVAAPPEASYEPILVPPEPQVSAPEEQDAAESDLALGSSPRAVPRSPEEARRVDEDLVEAEFAFDEERRYSRLPLYLLVALVCVISGVLVWMLLMRHGVEDRGVQSPQPRSQAPSQARPVPVQPQTEPAKGAAPLTRQPVAGERAGPGAAPAAPAGGVPAGNPKLAAGGAAPAPADDRAAKRFPGFTPAPLAGEQPATTPGVRAPGAEVPSTAPAPSPPPAAAAASAPAAGESVYSVHVASYKTMEQAYKDIATLQKNGFEARKVKIDLGSKGVWYRVYVGSYPTAAEAAKARDDLLKLPEFTKYAMVQKLRRE